MFDERQFIAQVEASDPESFAEYLRQPSAPEERALRAYFGDTRYERLHSLALRKRSVRGTDDRQTVIVIHGIMGAELTSSDQGGEDCEVWVNLWRIARGFLAHLRLADDGLTPFESAWETRATGMMKKHYGELILSVSRRWRVLPFWYDWRKDLNVAAAKLHAEIEGWLNPDEPAHIVAHSMGGLVARTFIQRFETRWNAMLDPDGARRGGRLVMLGTPNHGSFAVPQIITGLEKKIRQLARLDLRHNRKEVLEVVNSFPGSYQMLPSPLVMPEMKPLYRAQTYVDGAVLQAHLDNAQKHHEKLAKVVDKERMVYVAGDLQPTLATIKDFAKIGDSDGYELTLAGDGRVPHRLGLLDGVPTYYVRETHGALPSNPEILAALDDLLQTGKSASLRDEPAKEEAKRGGDSVALAAEVERRTGAEDEQIDEFLRRLQTRGSAEQAERGPISDEERRVEDVLLRGFVETTEASAGAVVNPVPMEETGIRIGLRLGSICWPDEADSPAEEGRALRVDAIAVGHYIGVLPQAAEQALDVEISEALGIIPPPAEAAEAAETADEDLAEGDDETQRSRAKKVAKGDLILAQYTQRGTIRGELGQPFFLPDPRKGSRGRVIALAGMGLPGRFGAPELTVTVRELCWSLGRLGKRHLAVVLIGGGNGNLEATVAVRAWMEGIYQALTSGGDDRLRQVTFVEIEERRIAEIQEAIEKARQEMQARLVIRYSAWSRDELAHLEDVAEQKEREWWERNLRGTSGRPQFDSDPAATRVTISLDGREYRFGAVTQDASIPERAVPLDPKLVGEANRELVAANSAESQCEHGEFLERLLIPRDLRHAFKTSAPLVLMLDATTARIHWELVAQPIEIEGGGGNGPAKTSATEGNFLGLTRGLTRQLRTAFAPPPEPPPAARRVLRVLVVADPAADARLAGAEEEGVEVVDLFEAFNEVHSRSENRVEVTRLFGPRSATRTNVLRHLMLRNYDMLHFAGHAKFDEDNPAMSGWIFSNGARLTANELDRIDRIPRFVFSNACESGITPDRSEDRSAALAPTFAEAFFARGVSNFVCTAWPVDDLFARVFARELYSGLLGLEVVDAETGVYSAREPVSMHQAMRDARRKVAGIKSGLRTWGAYQHYGSPYYRFFRRGTVGVGSAQAEDGKD